MSVRLRKHQILGRGTYKDLERYFASISYTERRGGEILIIEELRDNDNVQRKEKLKIEAAEVK